MFKKYVGGLVQDDTSNFVLLLVGASDLLFGAESYSLVQHADEIDDNSRVTLPRVLLRGANDNCAASSSASSADHVRGHAALRAMAWER